METSELEHLTDEFEIALAHTHADQRKRLWTVLALDQRLARIISTATEPMLAQMRLSWWREMLQSAPGKRPEGDAVLDAITSHWSGSENALIGLIDGWEHMLVEPPMAVSDIEAFSQARARAIAAANSDEIQPDDETRFNLLGRIWALSDLASKVESESEKQTIVELGRALCTQAIPSARDFKGLAVLAALGRRSLLKDGNPLLDGRVAALIAARAALFGR